MAGSSTAPARAFTELEILHDGLNNPPIGGHSFDYFRDPAVLGDMAPPGLIGKEITGLASAG